MKKIRICGIPYKVKEVNVIDESEPGVTNGCIEYSKATILLKKRLPKNLKRSVLFHEITHGILVQLGYTELAGDEVFVQALSQALFQMFKFKKGVYK